MPEITFECPSCQKALEKFSYRRFKCPHCRNWIYFRDDRLVTEQQKDEILEAGRLRWKREHFLKGLKEIGISEEAYSQRRAELRERAGVEPSKASVCKSLFAEKISGISDPKVLDREYFDFAAFLNAEGEDYFPYLQEASRMRIKSFAAQGFKSVEILAIRGCSRCQRLDGRKMSIAAALKLLPIPLKRCPNHPHHPEKSFCVCLYEGVDWGEPNGA